MGKQILSQLTQINFVGRVQILSSNNTHTYPQIKEDLHPPIVQYRFLACCQKLILWTLLVQRCLAWSFIDNFIFYFSFPYFTQHSARPDQLVCGWMCYICSEAQKKRRMFCFGKITTSPTFLHLFLNYQVLMAGELFKFHRY